MAAETNFSSAERIASSVGIAGASETEQRLIGDALRAGRLVLAEGERSVAVGGSADGATIVTGDGSVVLALDAAAAQVVRALLAPVPQLPSDVATLPAGNRRSRRCTGHSAARAGELRSPRSVAWAGSARRRWRCMWPAG